MLGLEVFVLTPNEFLVLEHLIFHELALDPVREFFMGLVVMRLTYSCPSLGDLLDEVSLGRNYNKDHSWWKVMALYEIQISWVLEKTGVTLINSAITPAIPE